MACFLACFGDSNKAARKRRREVAPPRVSRSAPEKPPPPNVVATLPAPVPSREIGEFSQRSAPEKPPENAVATLPAPAPRKETGPESFNSGRKRVTFDLNVKTYENISSSIREDSKYSSDEEAERAEDNEGEKTDRDEDDDDDIEDGEDIDIDGAKEESYDSYFSLPLNKNCNSSGSRSFSSAHRHEHFLGSEEVNSSSPSTLKESRGAQDRSKYVHSMLNPIEYSTQWKEVKAGVAPEKRPEDEKENINRAPETDPLLIPCVDSKKEVAIDASLSSWLVMVTGDLKIGDLKQSAASRSPASRILDDNSESQCCSFTPVVVG